MSKRYSDSGSTLSRLYDIGGADLALRYQELAERRRLGSAAAEAPRRETPAPRRTVYVNGTRISDENVAAMERAWNTAVVDGRYWYDSANGAWGVEGGRAPVSSLRAGRSAGR